MNKCMGCARPMVWMRAGSPPPGMVRSSARGLCLSCYHRARDAGTLDRWPLKRHDTSYRVEEVEWLAAGGVSPEHWAARLGVSDAALARSLYRRGRPDLARQVGRIVKRERVAA